ncbi:MAG: tRNA (adenosine(37)-N6)-dimethylallyltransferase MiaA [Puniceicoccales bacterium]|jgi:tRNA dimethylallyltransferase|nr:tRNA (adenosine(37)-N6)-dimethylallyltransferase MiaA [Puniceicoccales bacterium]
MSRPRLLLIVGPTGVGKSALAMELAVGCGGEGEILSADSIQVYRGMDIGSAKPNAADRARVPHHCIDLCDPCQPFDVAQYQRHARRAVEEIHGRGRKVLVVGGSGLYLGTFLGPVTDAVVIDPKIRREVEEIFLQKGLAGLLAALDGLHHQPPTCLDRSNAHRVMRALERCLATGLEVATLRRMFQSQPGHFADCSIRTVLLDCPDHSLRPRLIRRIDAMLAAGFVEEVEALRAKGFEANSSACRAVGYREVLQFLDGTVSRANLAERIYCATVALVRRQRTWFRHQIPIDRRCQVDELPPLASFFDLLD